MKKFDILKTVQLVVFVGLAAVSLFQILTDPRLYHLVATDAQIRTLCILLWLVLVLSFLFIFLDFSHFSSFKREYKELDFAVSSDPVAGIANRYSCDALIEKYVDQPLPDNIGCIMFELTNLREINKSCGHLQGNELIREFSLILQSSSAKMCFVGRNGGNEFIALFENCSRKKLINFLKQVSKKVAEHNDTMDNAPIAYRYGVAFNEGHPGGSITELVALSARRARQSKKQNISF